MENAQRERDLQFSFIFFFVIKREMREMRSFFGGGAFFFGRSRLLSSPPRSSSRVSLSLSRERERQKKLKKSTRHKTLDEVCLRKTDSLLSETMNERREKLDARRQRSTRRREKGITLIRVFFCSSRVRAYLWRARENFVIRRRLGNFETMAPLPSQCARAFSRTRQLIQTPLWNFVRVRASLMRRFFEWRQVNRRENCFFLFLLSPRVSQRVCSQMCVLAKKRAWRRCAHKYVSATISPVRNWRRCGEKGISFSWKQTRHQHRHHHHHHFLLLLLQVFLVESGGTTTTKAKGGDDATMKTSYYK